jgi:hypothetical protein
MSARSNRRYVELSTAEVSAEWLPEPELSFGGNGQHCDPKTGIALYGPKRADLATINIGLVGTRSGIEAAQELLERYSKGVGGSDSVTPFPGMQAGVGYRATLRFTDRATQEITNLELTEIVDTKKSRDRFDSATALLDNKIRLVADRDAPVDSILVVIPDDLYRRTRVVDYRDKVPIHRDLRRVLKANAMVHNKPTQLLRESTITRSTPKGLDHEATVAWNLFTGMFFKAGGVPWTPVDLTASSCFVGVSFFRPHGDTGSMRASVAQAFDERGNGWVLRGGEFPWNEQRDGSEPHLPPDLAAQLVKDSIARYREGTKTQPSRIVIHKQSRFDEAERRGFKDAIRAELGSSAAFDLVGLRRNNTVRLIREGKYAPLRGTQFDIGPRRFLYSTGYVPYLGTYPHGHVPSPIELVDHHGDSSPKQIFREVLGLTKLNWNSAGFAETFPITLRFSSLVGDVLREVPAERTPNPRYAFYM